ncbi:hypothetical protein [Pseudomonas sp.]|uniref:phage tail fiber protein n=2 Tax=Pseudomonas TaxID=286 RepID=UPI00289A89A5|nr:hypothetical protein [Pseudomonas sp.]
MPWYRSGTVAITAGQTSVVGTNTDFAANARVGDAFQGPDGRWYEVANIASATVLSILPAYQGATVSAGGYGLAPMQGYVKDSADALRAIVNQYGTKLAALGTTGNYDILPVAKGGTGGTTAADARAGLGLGSVATESILPVAKGGTGGASASAARTNLGLGSAAVATLTTSNYDSTVGSVLRVGDFGLGGPGGGVIKAPNLTYVPGFSRFNGEEAGVPHPGTGGSVLTNTLGGSYIQQIAQDPSAGIYNPYVAVRHFSAQGSPGPWCAFYHTGNTTRASGGALSAASPILRVADVDRSERRDLLEQSFEPAGAYGATNDEARGVTVERTGVGVYVISGSLGLALEGWRIQDPCSPDGGRVLGITQSDQDSQGVITLRLFKQRWTLDEEGEMHLGPGAPLDVPLNSWIDVRLEMPPKPDAGAPEDLPA